jgi:hypothetical protein
MKIIYVLAVSVVLAAGANCYAAGAKSSPSPKIKKFALWNFDAINDSCRAKGRLQDKQYCASQMMDQIIAQGKDAIPVLISQLTETRPTRKPIYDYWARTTSGDVAFFILHDLFTDSDWKTFNLPGVTSPNEGCSEGSQGCWMIFLKKHGRRPLQQEWEKAWEANKDRIYWNETVRCFRLSPSR